MSAPLPDVPDQGKPFLAHLEDLRQTLIWCAVSLVLGVGIACPLAPRILALLKMPLAGAGVNPDVYLKVINIGDGFSVAMQVVFWSGLLLATPGMVASIVRFVYPGLTRRERRVVTQILAASTALFALGVFIGYATTLKVTLKWMLQFNRWMGIEADFAELSNYCGFVLKLLLAFGLVFELPILIVLLGALGLVSSAFLREKRRHVIVVLMTIAMFVTPPDPLSMILMSAPLIILNEGCIWIVWLMERRGRAIPSRDA
ncbi:MAG: twin-arginine translocase subunit TatC [Lentisphaerae bacterium]|nr:twin-arginine translocase subunit TatC [Lentisphaerota bacterium]